jgi:hypothetical protein
VQVIGRTATWTRTGPTSWGALNLDGSCLVEAGLRGGMWRTNGAVSVDAELREREAVAAAAVMVFGLLRDRDMYRDPSGPG